MFIDIFKTPNKYGVIYADPLLGDIPRIELFARDKKEGWDCWGNDLKISPLL